MGFLATQLQSKSQKAKQFSPWKAWFDREVAHVPAHRFLLPGLPGCLGPNGRGERGFWRHPLDRYRQSIYFVPRMVTEDTVKGTTLKSSGEWRWATSYQAILIQQGYRQCCRNRRGAVSLGVLEGFLEEVMSEWRGPES